MKLNMTVLIGGKFSHNKDAKEAFDSLAYIIDGWEKHYNEIKGNKITHMIDANEVKDKKEEPKIIIK